MKLNSHERKIVSRINKGEIYDIPSYLRSFNKGRIRSYDMTAIKSKFAAAECGKKYKVMKEGHSLIKTEYSTSHIMGHEMHMPLWVPRSEAEIAEDEWEYREAVLDEHIPALKFTYAEQEFSLNFQKGALVADDFNDILNFIRLWSYLRRENLVFEVSQPVSENEISMLCELVPHRVKEISAEIKIEWDSCSSDGKKQQKSLTDGLPKDFHQEVPTRRALAFLDERWKLNEDHLMMCREYLGKRMYPTDASHGYAANNYRTADEVNRSVNTIVAVAALLISVLSFAYGLVAPKDTYHAELSAISQQVSETKEILDDIAENQVPEGTLTEMTGTLHSIETMISEGQDFASSEAIESVAADIKEIRSVLSKYLTGAE